MELGKSILPFLFFSSSVLSRSNILQSRRYFGFVSFRSRRICRKIPNLNSHLHSTMNDRCNYLAQLGVCFSKFGNQNKIWNILFIVCFSFSSISSSTNQRVYNWIIHLNCWKNRLTPDLKLEFSSFPHVKDSEIPQNWCQGQRGRDKRDRGKRFFSTDETCKRNEIDREFKQ